MANLFNQLLQEFMPDPMPLASGFHRHRIQNCDELVAAEFALQQVAEDKTDHFSCLNCAYRDKCFRVFLLRLEALDEKIAPVAAIVGLIQFDDRIEELFSNVI